MTDNHLVRLKSRPRGLATRDNFTLAKEPIPDLREGEIAIETRFISLDPAMRGWMSDAKSYVPPVDLGAVMRAYFGLLEVGARSGSRLPVEQHRDRRGVRQLSVVDQEPPI